MLKSESFGLACQRFVVSCWLAIDIAQHACAAIEACTKLISEYEVPIRILDNGGGFPVDYDNGGDIDIAAFCAPIREALKNCLSMWK
ncbi:MAG: hypothetical protein R3E61_08345 [Pseudomonadales bacterium]